MASYQAITVILTAEQEKFIAEHVDSGYCQSATDVIAQSLAMLRAQEEFTRSHVAALLEKIASGREQIRRGETVDGKAAT